jgi:hypothetical protein
MRRNYFINNKEIKIEQNEISDESEVLSIDDSVEIDNSKEGKSETDKMQANSSEADSIKQIDIKDSNSLLDEEDEHIPSRKEWVECRRKFFADRLAELNNDKLTQNRVSKMELFKEWKDNPGLREIYSKPDSEILKKNADSLIERFLAGENIEFPHLRKPKIVAPYVFFLISLEDRKIIKKNTGIWNEMPEKFKKKYYDEYDNFKREKYDAAQKEYDKLVKEFYKQWSYFAYYLLDMRFIHQLEWKNKEFIDFCRDNWNNSTNEFKEKYRNMYFTKNFDMFLTELSNKQVNLRWKIKYKAELFEVLYQKLRNYNKNWEDHKIREEINCIFEEAMSLQVGEKACFEEKEWIRKFLEKKNPPKEKSSSSNTNKDKKEVAAEPAENIPFTNNISATKHNALPKKAKKTQKNPETLRTDKKTKSLIIN